MSRAPSSKRSRWVAVAALAALWPVACSHSNQTAVAVETAKPHGSVGYVRMDDLVKRHPLYGQLSRLDDDMAALALKSVGGPAALPPADLQREQVVLQRELNEAAQRTREALNTKQSEYAKRESEAIRQAIGASGGSAGGQAGAGSIASGIEQQLQQQAKNAAADADKNLQVYRRQVIGQDQTAMNALQKSLNERAARSYRSKVEELQRAEADYALQLAQNNSPDRVSLRAKLSNLVLDDAAREDARKQVEALDRKEADELAAMKNRDATTLAALQKQLRDTTGAELDKQTGEMKRRTLAKINARELQTRRELATKLGGPAPLAHGSAGPAGGLPPDMRVKLEALHKKYQDDFNRDAKQTLADFAKTRNDLSQRYAKLQGVDSGARAGSDKQLRELQRQRGQLYDQMLAQIEREVKAIAARRGINVVLSDVVAPVGGVDLTPDAEKDIESLHE